MIGVITFIFPISLLIVFGSLDFVHEAYAFNEVSGDPGGLTHRWLIKSMIPISFVLLMVTSIGYFIKNLNIYLGLHHIPEHKFEEKKADK